MEQDIIFNFVLHNHKKDPVLKDAATL